MLKQPEDVRLPALTSRTAIIVCSSYPLSDLLKNGPVHVLMIHRVSDSGDSIARVRQVLSFIKRSSLAVADDRVDIFTRMRLLWVN